jgi:hypothetical protein
MNYQVTEEDLTELIGDDLTLAASLAKLINENGDIRAFLEKKLIQRNEELVDFYESQQPRWTDKEVTWPMYG